MKQIYSLTAAAILLFGFSSCVSRLVSKGDQALADFAFADAIERYEKALSKKSMPEVHGRLGDAYRFTNNPVAAERNYGKALDAQNPDPIYYFWLGAMQMENAKPAEALKSFEAYKAKTTENTELVDAYIEAAKNPQQFKGSEAEYTIKKADLKGVNAAFSAAPLNFGWVFSGDVVADKDNLRNPATGYSFLNLYYTKQDAKSKVWSEPAPLKGDINTQFHDGFATFSADGKTMYFTRTNTEKGKLKVNKDKVANLKIFKAELISDEWITTAELPFNSDDFSNVHPALSKDGKTLYFASDRPGGLGSTDLYMCTWDGTAWSNPMNLGSTINTMGREAYPVAGNGDTLYFSSDGRPGIGGLDIFMTVRQGNGWSTPVNMKSPINSSRDDFGYNVYKEGELLAGNFSSNRTGNDQIHEFVYKLIIGVSGTVKVKGTNEPFAGARAYLLNKTTGKLDSANVSSNGTYSFELKRGYDYAVYAASEGFFANSVEFTTKDLVASKQFTIDLEIDRVVMDQENIVDILYDYNKWDIRPDAAIVLDGLVKLLRDNPSYTIEFGSHTDCRGTDEYNQRLSENRAKSVYRYCVNRKIDPKRLSYKGFGESKPKVQCNPCESCSEEQHQINRRTEFRVIK